VRDATHFRVHGIPDDRGAEWILHRPGGWTAARPLAEALAAPTAPATEAIDVVGNHGRWIANCPDCNSAQLACATDHRFMCSECANIAIGGLWRPVHWPRDHQELGELISVRADRTMQNYEPGESVAQIREQNAYLEAVAAGRDHPGGPGLPSHHPGKASLHEGHTHRWPKQVKADKVYSCPVCGLELPGLAILADREADR